MNSGLHRSGVAPGWVSQSEHSHVCGSLVLVTDSFLVTPCSLLRSVDYSFTQLANIKCLLYAGTNLVKENEMFTAKYKN